MLSAEHFSANVFINCPFDQEYDSLLRAIVFTVTACGYFPCSALQERDGGAIRLEKIKALIRTSRLAIHDISRTAADAESGLPRFNMPFELGLDTGAREYGDGLLKTKRLLILDRERYRFQKYLSDIAGQDIAAHGDSPALVIEIIRAWLNSLRHRATPPITAAKILLQLHDAFAADLVTTCFNHGLDSKALDFNDFSYFAKRWITSQS